MTSSIKSTDDKNKILVTVRIRPLSKHEMIFGNGSRLNSGDIGVHTEFNKIVIKNNDEKNSFIFNNILDSKSNQLDTYEKTSKNIIESVFLGYTGAIITYGQTGSGKTHTMIGEMNGNIKKGIIPRSLENIFEKIKLDKKHKYNLFVSKIQIYMENVFV